jgi:hypothetical protein
MDNVLRAVAANEPGADGEQTGSDQHETLVERRIGLLGHERGFLGHNSPLSSLPIQTDNQRRVLHGISNQCRQ